MLERLFVYGTLGPGRPNEHVLTAIGGHFESASIRGVLKQQGWGAEMGYPGIVLDKKGNDIDGFIFSSENLAEHWQDLDSFEGEAYQRILTEIRTSDGHFVNAYIYTLCSK